jgi:hypothetical protein
VRGLDANKFTLVDNKLTFEAQTDLNAVNKTIGAKTALLLVLMTNIR